MRRLTFLLVREVQDLKSAVDDQTRNYRDLQVCLKKFDNFIIQGDFYLQNLRITIFANTLKIFKYSDRQRVRKCSLTTGTSKPCRWCRDEPVDHRWNHQFCYLHHVHHHQGQVHHLHLLSWSQFFVTRRRKMRKLVKRWRQSIGCVKKFRLDFNVDVKDKRTKKYMQIW